MGELLSKEEQRQLLKLARQAIEDAVYGRQLPCLDLDQLEPKLRLPGATFVTLTSQGDLRGCIGALEPSLPLAEDVRQHAVAAALQDPRFPPVSPEELQLIRIEVSRLTLPQPLHYDQPADLAARLRPYRDGVILRSGPFKATFLPQVWDKIPCPETFLDHLCLKMGLSQDYWRFTLLDVFTYQVEEFHE